MEVMPSLPEEEEEEEEDDGATSELLVSEAVVGTSADCSGAAVSAVSSPFTTTASEVLVPSAKCILSLKRLSIVGVAAQLSAL